MSVVFSGMPFQAEPLERRSLLAATLVSDIGPGQFGSHPRDLIEVGGTLVFSADNGRHGRELWRSDGTRGGTGRIDDIFPGRGGADPQKLTNVNGTLFFTADDGIHGRELWTSDGTAAGTRMVKDLTPGAAGTFHAQPLGYEMTAIGATLYFKTPVSGPSPRGALWRTDGTSDGTVLLKEPTGGPLHGLTELEGALYFAEQYFYGGVDDFLWGGRIWRSDGTAGGTTVVHNRVDNDVYMLGGSERSIFFAVSNNTTSIVTTDGTVAGAHGVGIPGLRALRIWASAVGDEAFFMVDIEARPQRRELWHTDGTGAGSLVGSFIPPDLFDGYGFANPRLGNPQLVDMNGTLHFVGRRDDQFGIWRSDGTPQGTLLATPLDIAPDTVFEQLLPVQGSLYFSAAGKLWRDGRPVADVDPASADDHAALLTVVGDKLLWSSYDAVHGQELWSMPLDFAFLDAGGTLRVSGTEANDHISLFVRGSTLRVWREGEATMSFSLADVKHIEIDADGGDDVVDWTGVAIPTYCFGGLGNDRMTAGTGDDTLSGGGGRDHLSGGDGNDFVSGGATNDELYGGAGNDHLTGGASNDILIGGPHNDRLYGDAGNDVLHGGAGKDVMYGGDGDDALTGGPGWDLHAGQAGNDRLFARDARDDEVGGGAGEDTAEHDDALDVLLGVETTV